MLVHKVPPVARRGVARREAVGRKAVGVEVGELAPDAVGVVVAALVPVQRQRLLPHLAGPVALAQGGVGVADYNGALIGTVQSSFFPTYDDALVRVTNTAGWTRGPWVDCGTITAERVTVNYRGGFTVRDLTRHDACVEPGDSGGSNYRDSGTRTAEGVTSGALLSAANRCGQNATPSFPNESYYYPAALSVPHYNSTHGVTPW
ncbi:hypothetical protein [Saccharothrix syringae]|uniref:hypothetical protein n=1 Tax=Saccharothrix syringae TaxID=103733 RepID=UPI000523FD37|nr:hypothetical protein [Saccharothrix syringae]